jgi:hypothetical protein
MIHQSISHADAGMLHVDLSNTAALLQSCHVVRSWSRVSCTAGGSSVVIQVINLPVL